MIKFSSSLLLSVAIPALLSPALVIGQDTRPDNVPPPGFVALFNGTDLAGWKGLVADPPKRAKMSGEELAKAQAAADQSMREHWKADGGVLVFDGKGDSLCTARDYGDFEFLVDWKILPAGDSGIYLRGSPQVQIWDREEGSGGLFNNEVYPSKALERADRPVGEWNTFRILMVGQRAWVRLNGVTVVNGTVLENYWQRDQPIYPSGQIELQNHGNTLYFKNIYVREIPRPVADQRLLLKKGDRVAVVGDSITEQRLYSRYIEDYLLACASELDLRVMQFGWSGERAPGFAARMDNDLLPYRPDLITTCYGMNDGSYRVYEPSIGATYEKHMLDIVRRAKASGARMVVGSPGAVDTFSFKRGDLSAADYNANLGHLRDIAQQIAVSEGMAFANVHDAMVRAMQRAKPALGEAYHVCGGDGFHPAPNGHLVMAYAFLKGMGLSGDIGRISVDLKSKATASPGHEVRSSSGGKVEIESRRYPFCFAGSGDDRSPDSLRGILPYVPFNYELNRLMLVVKGVETPKAKITWGPSSKEFTRGQLAEGINLAAEFLDNPFSEPFGKLDDVVKRKQAVETTMIKEVITRFRGARDILGDDAEAKEHLRKLTEGLFRKQEALHAQARAAVVPVTHTILIEPQAPSS